MLEKIKTVPYYLKEKKDSYVREIKQIPQVEKVFSEVNKIESINKAKTKVKTFVFENKGFLKFVIIISIIFWTIGYSIGSRVNTNFYELESNRTEPTVMDLLNRAYEQE